MANRSTNTSRGSMKSVSGLMLGPPGNKKLLMGEEFDSQIEYPVDLNKGIPETWANEIMRQPVVDFEEMITKLQKAKASYPLQSAAFQFAHTKNHALRKEDAALNDLFIRREELFQFLDLQEDCNAPPLVNFPDVVKEYRNMIDDAHGGRIVPEISEDFLKQTTDDSEEPKELVVEPNISYLMSKDSDSETESILEPEIDISVSESFETPSSSTNILDDDSKKPTKINGLSTPDNTRASQEESDEDTTPIISEVKSLSPSATNGNQNRVIVHKGIDSNGNPTSRVIKLIEKPSRKQMKAAPNPNLLPTFGRSPKIAEKRHSPAKLPSENNASENEAEEQTKLARLMDITEEIEIDALIESKDLIANGPPMQRKIVNGIEVINCSLCGKNFSTSVDHMYRRHMVAKHHMDIHEDTLEEFLAEEQTHRCRKCNLLLGKTSMETHADKCEMKGKGNINLGFEELLIRSNPKSIHQCSLCILDFENRVLLRHHLCAFHPAINFKVILEPHFRCAVCLLNFDAAGHLLRHAVDCTPRIPKSDTVLEIAKRLVFECDVCLKHHRTLEESQLCYSRERLYRCLLCCKIFAKKESFFRHLDLYHDRTIAGIRCPFCTCLNRSLVRYCFEHIVYEHYDPVLKARRITGAGNVILNHSWNFCQPKKLRPSIIAKTQGPKITKTPTVIRAPNTANIVPIAPKPGGAVVPTLIVKTPAGPKRLPILKPKPSSTDSKLGSVDNPIILSPNTNTTSMRNNSGNVYLPLTSFVRKSPLVTNSKKGAASSSTSSYILQGNTLRPVVATAGSSPGQYNIRPVILPKLPNSSGGNVRLIFTPSSNVSTGFRPIRPSVVTTGKIVKKSDSTTTTASTSGPVVTSKKSDATLNPVVVTAKKSDSTSAAGPVVVAAKKSDSTSAAGPVVVAAKKSDSKSTSKPVVTTAKQSDVTTPETDTAVLTKKLEDISDSSEVSVVPAGESDNFKILSIREVATSEEEKMDEEEKESAEAS